jgi:predicted AAA+ superfamily ATPase
MHLRRQNQPLYYFRENRECDFVVFRDKNCSMVIQVCETLSNDNLNRETEGLEEAMRFFGLKEGYIITREQKDLFRRNQLMIHVLPANEFLINSVTDYL